MTTTKLASDKALFRCELPLPTALIDTHVNIGTSDWQGRSFNRIDWEGAVKMLLEAGVTGACALPPLIAEPAEANAHILGKASVEKRVKVFPFARIPGSGGPRPVQGLWQARRALRAKVLERRKQPRTAPGSLEGYSGVKLAPHLSGIPHETWFEEIRRLDLPMLIHSGTHSPPRWICSHLLPRTTGPILLAHLGSFPCSAECLQDAVALAAEHPRVFLETSAVGLTGFIDYAVRRVPEKILFASDMPMMHPSVAWGHLVASVRDDAVLNRIAFENAEAFFGGRLSS